MFLPIEDTGEAKCNYCGARYRLIEGGAAAEQNG
ncbi:MAG: zinc-finger domain-containing protein [Rhizobiales bacterium]|nr:zinc-finger domain-containing protein [Hyphomicrobiales bacterium]